MQFTTSILTTLSLISSVLTLPAPQSMDKIVPTGPTYLLHTRLTPGQEDKTQYDGLYLLAYHTGAGLNDAVVGSRSNSRLGYLNGTYQQFIHGGGFEMGLNLGYLQPYTAWAPVHINGGRGDGDYAINESGLVVVDTPDASNNNAHAWGGWRVCDGSHGVPQLYWVSQHRKEQAYPVPASCADVQLVLEYTS